MLKRVEPHASVSFALWFAALFAEPPSDPPCEVRADCPPEVRKAIEIARAEAARPADYASVRAQPRAKPKRYDPLTREVELELIRRYHEHGDEEALEQLVGAHRPMVVRMAKNMWRGTTPLKALVEYGMMGLRIAAEPPRPSRRPKKVALVGFDASKGSRFSTHARPYAKKEMQMAVSGLMVSGSECEVLPDEYEHKTTATVEELHRARMVVTPRVSPLMVEIFSSLLLRDGLPEKCRRPISLWSLGEPKSRKVRRRNYLKHGITDRELANRDLEYRWCHMEPAEPAVERKTDYDVGYEGTVIIKRHRPFTPFLCWPPLDSIYLLRGQIRQYVILLAAGLYINEMEI